MKKNHKILIVVLLVQIALCVVTIALTSSDPGNEPGLRKLVDVDLDDIIGLKIEAESVDKKGSPSIVELENKDGQWQLKRPAGYPVVKDKVVETLTKLLDMKVREKIASSKTNHDSLKVGEREWGRKVVIRTKDKTISLVMGEGSGSSVHVRMSNENDVYRSTGLSIWNLAANASRYIESKLLDVKDDEVSAVKVTGEKGPVTLTKKDDKWELAELPMGTVLDETKVKSFVDDAIRVNMSEPVSDSVNSSFGLDQGVSVLVEYNKDNEAKSASYSIGAQTDDNKYYLKMSDDKWVVTVSKWSVDQLVEKNASDLIKSSEN